MTHIAKLEAEVIKLRSDFVYYMKSDNEWKSVAQELPPREELVLVSSGPHVYILKRSAGWEDRSGRHTRILADYWMPLPKPPTDYHES